MGDTLRELQLCELGILRETKKVCEKHGIRFVLACGTLLGAVRHRGFIPWDDDIDIEMPYDDYLRFQEIAQNEMGDDYFIQTCETDPLYHFPYLRVQKKNTALINEWEKNSPGHHRISIDVFPLADLGGRGDFRLKKTMIRVSTFLRMDAAVFHDGEDWIRHQGGTAMFRLVKLARRLPERFRRKLSGWILKTFVFRHKNTPDVTFVWTTVTSRIPREVYDEPYEMMWFEDDYYPVPRGYDTYLTIIYEDYMQFPPPEKRKPRHPLLVNFEKEYIPGEAKEDEFKWEKIC